MNCTVKRQFWCGGPDYLVSTVRRRNLKQHMASSLPRSRMLITNLHEETLFVMIRVHSWIKLLRAIVYPLGHRAQGPRCAHRFFFAHGQHPFLVRLYLVVTSGSSTVSPTSQTKIVI